MTKELEFLEGLTEPIVDSFEYIHSEIKKVRDMTPDVVNADTTEVYNTINQTINRYDPPPKYRFGKAGEGLPVSTPCYLNPSDGLAYAYNAKLPLEWYAGFTTASYSKGSDAILVYEGSIKLNKDYLANKNLSINESGTLIQNNPTNKTVTVGTMKTVRELILSPPTGEAGDEVSILDTNKSHYLTFTWNENDTAHRVLNVLVGGASRSLTFEGDAIVSQDYSTDSRTVQFAREYLYDDIDDVQSAFNILRSRMTVAGAGALTDSPGATWSNVKIETSISSGGPIANRLLHQLWILDDCDDGAGTISMLALDHRGSATDFGILEIGTGVQHQLTGNLYLKGGENVDGKLILNDLLLGTPTYDSINDLINNTQSAGITSGFTITDSGSGEVDIAPGTGILKTTDSVIGANKFFDYAGTTNLALTDDSSNWIYIDYNGGTPVAAAVVDWSTLNLHTQIIIGKVYRDGTTLHIVHTCQCIEDVSRKNMQSTYEIHGAARAQGLILSTVSRYVEVTAGGLWEALTRHSIAALDTDPGGGADTFSAWHVNSGTWTEVTAQTQIDNLQYNNPAAGLATLTANRYAVHWVYVGHDGHLQIQYGQGDYLLAQAEAASVPTPPSLLADFAILVGKIIIRKSAASATSTESAFTTIFVGTAPSDHASLANLNWSSAGHTMNTDLDMVENDINNVVNLKVDHIGENVAAHGIVVGSLMELDAGIQIDGSVAGTHFKDEDNMVSDAADAVCSQQSIKAYVDAAGGGGDVTAGANLTDETLVQGDGGAKGIKTSVVTVAEVQANTLHISSAGGDHSQVVTNQTHIGSNGQDHGDVVLNNTHRASDGTDHAHVVINDTHVAGDGSDHADVATNTVHIGSDGSDHSLMADVVRMETGSYVGDGGTSNEISLTDTDLIVKYIRIWHQGTGDGQERVCVETTDTIIDDAAAKLSYYHNNSAGQEHRMMDNMIIALGTGSFTVDDDGANGAPNANGLTYNYMVLGTYA